MIARRPAERRAAGPARTGSVALAGSVVLTAACALALGSCGVDRASSRVPPAASATTAPSDSSGSVASTALPDARVPMPGPARERLDAAVNENAACVRCHAEVAGEWDGSLHHRADVEPAYQRSFAIEPMPFCRACHAPESVATTEEPAKVRDLGVGCVTCHVTEPGKVLAVPLANASPFVTSRAATDHGPHEIVRDARFAEEGACAGCHEFAFPMREPKTRADLMQSTIAEHAESPGKALSCASCHMPFDEGRRRNHSFTTTRDADAVRRAVRIEATRLDARHVRISLAPNELGHAFPTGDLFRRLEISAEVVGPDDMVISSAVRFLARHFGVPQGMLGRRLLSDDRVTASGAVVDLDVGPEAGGHEIAWRVAYQRVSHPNGIDETNATLEGELTLASGRLAPDQTAPK